MNEVDIQKQINELNSKMDLLLEYVKEQKLKSEKIEDLISDFSIIGKDVYDSTVEELENRQVDLNPAELTDLGIKFLRNIKNFNSLMDTLESVMDLTKDVGPIANEVIIDISKKLGEFDKKGYFEFLREFANVIDNVITGFEPKDVKLLADNVVTILNTVKQITQPDMMNSVNNAVKIYSSLQVDNIPEYSLWKAFREMNSPEVKKGLGFLITFMKNISRNSINK
ncbi:MAG: hypothetical protein AUJ98_00830 [Bacteroidetes bacterium CG2_30_33_31]|nr:MAG: hypothetical protein AUJ98_00830 [Bacteroidetes bacterium CG2_30_33_31]